MISLVKEKKDGYLIPEFPEKVDYIEVDGKDRKIFFLDREKKENEDLLGGFPSCVFGIPSKDNILDKEFIVRILCLSSPPNFNTAWDLPTGFEVGDARNRIIKRAIDKGFSFVFFMDDDVMIPGDAFLKLYKVMEVTGAKVVSGLYYTKSLPASPLIFRGIGNGVYRGWKKGDIVEVTGCGMGCVIIDLSIFKNPQIDYPWFVSVRDSKEYDGMWMKAVGTEDLYFLAKVIKAGYKVLVDTSVFCMHRDRTTGKNYPLKEDILPEMEDSIEVI